MDKIDVFVIVDEEIRDLEAIGLRGTIPYHSSRSAIVALEDLKRRVGEHGEVPEPED
jgi:hypothetical protein